MNKIIIILLLFLFSNISAQKVLEKSFVTKYNTNIEFNDYKLVAPKSLYDIAINYAYTKAISNSKNPKYVNFPIIIITNKPIGIEESKLINPQQIKNINFTDGIENIIYGETGRRNGVLRVTLK